MDNETLQQDLDNALEVIEILSKRLKWISVEDELPPHWDDKCYSFSVIFYDGLNWYAGWYDFNDKEWFCEDGQIDNITFWMIPDTRNLK